MRKLQNFQLKRDTQQQQILQTIQSKKEIPFRDAHEIVGKVVAHAVSKKQDLDELSIEDFKSVSSVIEEDIFDFLNIEGSVRSKKTSGGTSYEEVNKQIEKAKNIIKEYEKN